MWISDFRFVRYEVQAGHRDLRCAARRAAASAWPAEDTPLGSRRSAAHTREASGVIAVPADVQAGVAAPRPPHEPPSMSTCPSGLGTELAEGLGDQAF